MAFLPPWISVNPSDFVGAAERGAQTGLSSRSETDDTNLRRQQLAQSASEEAARMGLASQQAGVEAQRSAVENEVAKQRSQLEWQDAAQRFGAQQKYQSAYQQLVNSGVSPEDAAMQAALTVGPAGGEGVLAGIAAAKRATGVPQFMDVNGVPVIQSPGGVTHLIPKSDAGYATGTGGEATESDDKKNQALLDSYTKILNSPDSTDADKENARQWIAAYSKPETATTAAPATPAPKPQVFIGAPGGPNMIPGYDNSGAPVAAPATASGSKVATVDILKQALAAAGGNKKSARQWLQQNGYTIPGAAASAPAASPAPIASPTGLAAITPPQPIGAGGSVNPPRQRVVFNQHAEDVRNQIDALTAVVNQFRDSPYQVDRQKAIDAYAKLKILYGQSGQ
jgi:hypothetical protein